MRSGMSPRAMRSTIREASARRASTKSSSAAHDAARPFTSAARAASSCAMRETVLWKLGMMSIRRGAGRSASAFWKSANALAALNACPASVITSTVCAPEMKA